jgi:hypothetical protein
MGLLTTFIKQLTAPFRDLKYGFTKIKVIFMMPFQRLLGIQRGITSDVRGLNPGVKLPGKPKL